MQLSFITFKLYFTRGLSVSDQQLRYRLGLGLSVLYCFSECKTLLISGSREWDEYKYD